MSLQDFSIQEHIFKKYYFRAQKMSLSCGCKSKTKKEKKNFGSAKICFRVNGALIISPVGHESDVMWVLLNCRTGPKHRAEKEEGEVHHLLSFRHIETAGYICTCCVTHTHRNMLSGLLHIHKFTRIC